MDHKSRTKATQARIHALHLAALPVLLLILAALAPPSLDARADSDSEAPRKDFDYAFTIKDLEGNRIGAETFKGKVIFLNLWATWCGPCRMEMAGIQALYNKVNKEKVVFIMLSMDRDEDQRKVVNYLRSKAFTFKAYMPSGSLTEQLTVPYIPTTFIVSPEGKIVRKEIGAQDFNTPEFEKLLEKLAQNEN